MTVAQRVIHSYISQNFEKGHFTFQDVEPDKVLIRDNVGEVMTLTINLYCDIMDADSGKIYAKSDLPHDLMNVGLRVPTSWTELER